MSDPPTQKIEISITDSLHSVSKTHTNVGQDFMITTEDKLRLCLHRHDESHISRQAWIAPFGIALTLLLALLTCNFQDRFGFSGDGWKAFFGIGLVVTIVWLVVTLWKILRCHTVDDVVAELKKTQIPAQPPVVSRN